MKLNATTDEAARARYRAAYESEAARKWIKKLPPAQRRRAEEIGLLKPYFDPPSFAKEFKENLGASNWKATFDENDFAFAALDDSSAPEYEDTDDDDENA